MNMNHNRISPDVEVTDLQRSIHRIEMNKDILKEQNSALIVSNLLKTNLFFLRIFGSYHKKNDIWIYKTYCILVILMAWFFAIKSIFMFNFTMGGTDVFINADLAIKIVVFIWFLSCAATLTLFFFFQTNKSRMIKFDAIYEEIFHEYQENEISETKLIKKITSITTLIAFSMALGNSILTFVSFFGPEVLHGGNYYNFLAPFQNSSWVENNIPYKILISIGSTLIGMALTLYFSYFFNYCFLAIRALKNFNVKFKDLVFTNKIDLKNRPQIENESAFNELFNWYLNLTNLLRCLNDCFKEFIGILLLMFIPAMFIFIWIIITWTSTCITAINTFLIPFWFIYVVMIVFLIILTSIEVNLEVKNFKE